MIASNRPAPEDCLGLAATRYAGHVDLIETRFLSGLFWETRSAYAAAFDAGLKGGHFHDPEHAILYGLLMSRAELHEAGQYVGVDLIREGLKRLGADWPERQERADMVDADLLLITLWANPPAENVNWLASQIVREARRRRRVQRAARLAVREFGPWWPRFIARPADQGSRITCLKAALAVQQRGKGERCSVQEDQPTAKEGDEW